LEDDGAGGYACSFLHRMQEGTIQIQLIGIQSIFIRYCSLKVTIVFDEINGFKFPVVGHVVWDPYLHETKPEWRKKGKFLNSSPSLSEVTSSGEIKKSMIEERKPVASGYKGE
jgi:hypothetical protein